MDYDEDYEIDTSSVFKQQASELATVTDLDGTLKKFGYAKDDRIERREMVLMYTAVEKDMEREIKRLASDTCFDEAKATRETLTKLRDEFCCLQTDATGTMLRDQSAYFEKAKGQMYAKLNAKHAEEQNYVAEQIEKARLAEKKKHDIQTENLEKAIARIRRPNVKYTKRMIELFKAESGLISLCQYEEAKKVRHMIDKILPKEKKEFYKKFDQRIENMRSSLKSQQSENLGRQEESLKAIQWKDMRRRENEQMVMTQRMKNHQQDMSHAHHLEARIIPEMSVKPSALSQKRPGFQSTASALRGKQLLDHCKGKQTGEQVIADTLVDKHNFDAPLQDTMSI